MLLFLHKKQLHTIFTNEEKEKNMQRFMERVNERISKGILDRDAWFEDLISLEESITKWLNEKGYDISSQHTDCGIEIFDKETQDTHSGGSGCGCAGSTLCGYILKQMESKTWKRVLFVPTGALLSKISFNEGQSVPGIAHAVMLNTEIE